MRVSSPVGRCAQELAESLTAPWVGIRNRLVVNRNRRDREYDVAVEGEVILGDPSWDVTRLADLVAQVTEDADYAERSLTATDLALSQVRRTLETDVNQ